MGLCIVFASLTQRASVLDTTNTIQGNLIAVAVAGVLVVVVHAPVVGAAAIDLAGTPPAAAVADIAETAIGIAVAARQGGKAIGVLAQVGSARAGRAALTPTSFRLQVLASSRAIVRAIGAACAVSRAVQGIPISVAGDMPA